MSSSAEPAKDLLEPFLCRELRRVAEATRDRQISETEVGVVIERLVERILALPTRWAITDVLRSLLRDISAAKGVPSRKALTSALCRLSKRPDPRSQIAGARMLAFLADRDEIAHKELRSLFTSEKSCLPVRGHAAIGLWRSGEPLQEVIESISAVSSEIATTAVREVESAFIHDIAALLESESEVSCIPSKSNARQTCRALEKLS